MPMFVNNMMITVNSKNENDKRSKSMFCIVKICCVFSEYMFVLYCKIVKEVGIP